MELVISLGALLVSLVALYLSHWHRSSKGILCLNSRYFDCRTDKTTRELSYTFSNTGNQELYVKEIALLMGPSPVGHLKCNASFLEVPVETIDSFVLKPGEIKPFKVVHDANFKEPDDSDPSGHRFMIVSLEVISADGKRYQVTHDISELGASGPELKHPIWSGVTLGAAI